MLVGRNVSSSVRRNITIYHRLMFEKPSVDKTSLVPGDWLSWLISFLVSPLLKRSHPIPAKGKGQVSRSINRNSQPCPSISTEIVKASRELNAWFISSNQSTLKGGKSSKGKAGTTRSSPRSELGFDNYFGQPNQPALDLYPPPDWYLNWLSNWRICIWLSIFGIWN